MNAKERKTTAVKLAELRTTLLDAVQAYNDLAADMDDLVEQFVRERMQEARDAVTAAATAFANEVEDTGSVMREYINEKSEAWQESETGEEWEAICSEFENVVGIDDLAQDTIDIRVTVEELDANDADNLNEYIEKLEEL